MDRTASMNEALFTYSKDLPDQVTLITPPSVFLLDERIFVSLGILKVGAMLERAGIFVDHLNLAGIENYIEALNSYLSNMTSKIIGITATTPQMPAVTQIVTTIRKVKPGMKIILGGPHVTLTHSAVKLEQKAGRISRAHEAFQKLKNIADVLVSGDGEYAVFQALQTGCSKLVDGDDPNGRFFMTNAAYENTPYPARHLVDLSTYCYKIEAQNSTSLIAQLGCPFECGFCGGRNSKSLRMIRMRSAGSIVSEVRFLYQTYGYTGFMFYDDELNVNKGFIELLDKLACLQKELKVKFHFRGFIKAQLFTQEQAQAMYRAGFRWILCGFESGSSRMLENMNKKSTYEDNSRVVELAKNAGLKVKALMSIGHPGESKETVEQTQKWLLEVQPEEFDCSIITTYPGTPYYDEALPHPQLPDVWTYTCKKTNDKLHAYNVDYLQVADYYKGDPLGGYQSFVFTDFLKAKEIVQCRDWIEKSVREKLKIPYPKGRSALRYEHSMGQGINLVLPTHILAQSSTAVRKKEAA